MNVYESIKGQCVHILLINFQTRRYVSTDYGNLDREELVLEQILGYHDNGWKVEGIFFDETNGVSETEQSTVLEMYRGYMDLTRSLWNSESRLCIGTESERNFLPSQV